MQLNSSVRRLAALAMILTLGACTRAQREQQQPITGAEFILEVHNPQPRAMNVSFTVAGATTALGTVAANETRRWAIPNQGNDNFRLIATDEGRTQTITKTLDLNKGEVVRWEIKD